MEGITYGGNPLSRMVEIAASKKIPIHYTREDLEEDFKGASGEKI